MNTPRTKNIRGLRLKLTSSSFPEQYDVYLGDEQVAYFRLRHGIFRVDIPECGGETIYHAKPKGSGQFEPDEREYYLTDAVQYVLNYRRSQNVQN